MAIKTVYSPRSRHLLVTSGSGALGAISFNFALDHECLQLLSSILKNGYAMNCTALQLSILNNCLQFDD